MLHPQQAFDRPALKKDARAAMARYSPKLYLITLLYLVIQYLPSLTSNITLPAFTGDIEQYLQQLELQVASAWGRGTGLWVVSLLLQVFLMLLTYGYCRYTLKISRGEECNVADLFSCFPQFGRFFLLYLLMNIFIFLWSCLLIVPGFIAAMSYSQAVYLMLDDPTLTPMQAIRKSKELMKGHKWEYFVLQLSFYGWALLSMFTFNLVNIWLQPYMDVTNGCYYNWLIGWQPMPDGSAPGADPEHPENPDPQTWEWWKE